MKKLLSLFGSMRTMVVLMSIFAAACGYATIIENDYGTFTAKSDIYNARWFEVLLALLTINLSYNIYKYKMFTLDKAPLFIFHIAFIVIIIGAAITRYVGYEGQMHIREGESASTMVSTDTFFSVDALVGDEKVSSEEIVYLSKKFENTLASSLSIAGKDVFVEMTEYIPNSTETSYPADVGDPMAEMMITVNGEGKRTPLRKGQFFESNDFIIDFGSNESFDKEVISMFVEDGQLYMKHNVPLDYLKMDDQTKGTLAPNENQPLVGRTLFSYKSSNFVLRTFFEHARTEVATDPKVSPRVNGYDAFKFKITVGDLSKEVMIFGQSGSVAKKYVNEVNGVKVAISYGSKILQLPFKIKLEDFQLDRYPGSMSPASYASEVTLIDEEQNLEFQYRIFMNNILEHRGYRFFQASFDPDERGTVLSVNNDPGTLPSYIGYFLLGLGMFWSLFSKRNRFDKLAKKAKKASEQRVLSLLVAIGLVLSATPSHAEELNPLLKTIISFDKEHAKEFGKLIVQDSAGRMKPLDTLSKEIISKIHRSPTLKVGKHILDSNQLILGMMLRPDAFRDIKFISTKDEKVNQLIGTAAKAKFASFGQFFTDPENMRGYKLSEAVESATRKEPKYRDKLDKAVLKIDERVNIAYMVYNGSLIKIWPKPNDENHKWYATIDGLQNMSPENGERIRGIAIEYFKAIDGALSSGEWSDATNALKKIANYQRFYGSDVYPSENKIAAEVLYNEADIFETLYPFYLVVGFVLLILSFVNILKPKFNIALYSKITLGLLILFFIAHTFGLGLRWYISGHAPWSNGYESMIYIGWATILAGFIFSKRSPMTMASTGILTGLILFVAHLNWMDPQVTTLVPVLNSYWLSIHVSMITASYGFLGLGALLGFIVIILFIIKTDSNDKRISISIKELNAINEMSLMVGLVLLTIGNFLGGVWANESWGRYWGWDPKETWALVTILVYAIILHLRFIKEIYTEFNFAVISLLSFSSVIMTYFGVNYYLSGLHSYAKGDPVPIPDFVPITYLIIFVVIAFAYRNRKLAK